MGKNKAGGKHKHQKNEVQEKYTFVEPTDDIFYVYITKAYGNRMFDGVILKDNTKIKFKAMMKKRRSQRVVVGGIITMSRSNDFSKVYYAVENICGDNEYRMIEKSAEYAENLKSVRNIYDISSSVSDNVLFDDEDDPDNCFDQNKESVTLESIYNDIDDDEELDIDDL